MQLKLADGTIVEGKSFGAAVSVSGEVVFNTGMVGYVETLSDPSYAGQILILTYPLVGNYGVSDASFFESKKIWAAGLVVAEYSQMYSNATAKESLAAWLTREGVPAMTGVDTRALTKILREHGVMQGELLYSKNAPKTVYESTENFVERVSPKGVEIIGTGKTTIVLVDCGAKENIARSLQRPDIRLIRVPWDYDFTKDKYDGVVLSNGPGDPTTCMPAVENVRKAFKVGKPIFGICLGTQLMALAAGGTTYKLKYGHRSQNQSCSVEGTDLPAPESWQAGRCYITSQNHGYAVDEKSLPKEWKVWFRNANDGSVEGIKHKTKPFSSVQFHPEAAPGPVDTKWLFDDFLREVAKYKK